MTTAEQRITSYLERLEALTVDLPPEVRADLLADVRAHLDEAQAVATTDAELQQALDRLGTPEAIATEARGTHAPGGPGPGATHSGPRRSDSVALALMLVVTALALPLVGPFALLIWIAGVTMLWSSPSWTTGEKTLGTLVWPGGLSLPLVLGLMAGPVVLPTWAGIPLLVALVTAPIAVAIALLRRANARADAATRAI